MVKTESHLMSIDTSMLKDARAGCSTSQEELFTAARQYLGFLARNAIDSDLRGQLSESDLVQDTLLAAQKGLTSLRCETVPQFAAWLRRIFANNLLNRYRSLRLTAKRDTSRDQSIDAGHVPETSLADYRMSESVSGVAMAKEEQALLRVALTQLNDDHRRAIELRHRDNLTFAEIGERMGRSADAARMLWYRAFQELTTHFRKLDADA